MKKRLLKQKRFCLLLIIMLVLTLIPVGANATIKEQGNIKVTMPEIADANYVAYVEKGVDEVAIEEVEKVSSEKIVNANVDIYQCNISDSKAEELNKLDQNIVVEKNIGFSASSQIPVVTDEQLEELQPETPYWNVEMIGTPSQGANAADKVKVAVMDSGVEGISDVPLADRVNLVAEEQEITPYMEDMTGHGTAVASIIAKINPQAAIYSVRVLDTENKTDLERVIRGIYWCMEQDIDVINMSFGTPAKSEILANVIQEAKNQGITIVAAAGNSGQEGVEYPAAYENTIAVGAVDNNAQKTDSSAIGDEVDVVAPGEDIQVESIFGMHTWAGGTSMAAAHVTAEASVILEKDTNKPVDFVKGLITSSAKDIGNEKEYGQGLVDITYAHEQYDQYANRYKQRSFDQNTIQENPGKVQKFTDQEISFEARWKTDGHNGAISQAIVNLDDGKVDDLMSGPALGAMKKGAVYQDTAKDAKKDKVFTLYWHGIHTSENHPRINYIAAYRFITKMAAFSGDTDKISKGITGLPDSAVTSMKGKVSTSKIGIESWSEAIGADLYTLPLVRMEKLRRCFLYGMAVHAATDAFAHSTFLTKDPKGQIPHPDADKTEKAPNRYIDAKAAAQKTVIAYLKAPTAAEKEQGQLGTIGGIGTFAPAMANRGKPEGYYLANVKYYAKEANGGVNSSSFDEWFDYIDYLVPLN